MAPTWAFASSWCSCTRTQLPRRATRGLTRAARKAGHALAASAAPIARIAAPMSVSGSRGDTSSLVRGFAGSQGAVHHASARRPVSYDHGDGDIDHWSADVSRRLERPTHRMSQVLGTPFQDVSPARSAGRKILPLARRSLDGLGRSLASPVSACAGGVR